MYTVYYMCLLLVYRNFLVHFSLDPRLLNSVRGVKRNFVGDVMMWKEKGVLGFHSHDMSSELVTAPEGKVALSREQPTDKSGIKDSLQNGQCSRMDIWTLQKLGKCSGDVVV